MPRIEAGGGRPGGEGSPGCPVGTLAVADRHRRGRRWPTGLGVLLRVGVLTVVLGLSGCSGGGSEGISLDFWAMGREGERVRALVSEFERLHPGIRVRVQQIPWSAAHEKLLTAYAGDVMPDVYQLGNTWIPEFVALRALAPLGQRVRDSHELSADDFFPGILEANRLDDRLWGIPWYVDTRLLFYRKDALARAGYTTMPRSWAEWEGLMQAIVAGGPAGAHAILLPLDDWTPPVVFAMQLGADLLRDDARHGDFLDPGFARAFGFYLDLFDRGWAPGPGSMNRADLYQAFASGEVAMAITGPWNIAGFEERLPPALQGSWETAPLPAPRPPGPGVSIAGGASLVMSRASEHPQAAWQLLEYLSTTASQVRFHALTGDLPARRSAWQAAGLKEAPHTRAFWVQLQHVRAVPRIPEWERIADKIAYYAEVAIRGEMSREQALQALNADADRILEKRRWLLQRQGRESLQEGPRPVEGAQ